MSQTQLFRRSLFSSARDHPASYGVQDQVRLQAEWTRQQALLAQQEVKELPPPELIQALAMETLVSQPEPSEEVSEDTDPNLKFYIVEDVRQLAEVGSSDIAGKTVLVAQGKKRITIFEEHDAKLLARQSRWGRAYQKLSYRVGTVSLTKILHTAIICLSLLLLLLQVASLRLARQGGLQGVKYHDIHHLPGGLRAAGVQVG